MKSMSVCQLVFLLVSTLFAQSSPDTLWTRIYGAPGYVSASAVIPTPDGCHVVIGDSVLSSYDWDGYVLKVDSRGDPLWSRTFGGSGDDRLQSGETTHDSGCVLIGSTRSYGSGLYDYWLLKVNSSGDSLWSRTYGSQMEDVGVCVRETRDGGYVLGGVTTAFGGGMYVVKTDSLGNELWAQKYGGGEDVFRTIRQTADDGYVVAGRVTGTAARYFKIDSAGTPIWDRYLTAGCLDAMDIQVTLDGGYAISGESETGHLALVKADSVGIPLWVHSYGNGHDDAAYSIIELGSGGYLLGGYTSSGTAGGYDCVLVGTDCLGNMAWMQCIGTPRDDFCLMMRRTLDGGCIMAGSSRSSSGSQSCAYVVRTEPITEPCYPTPLPFIDNFDNPDLDSCWFWIREDTSHWSLTERPGWMRIWTQGGYISWGTDKNILLRSRPEGSFRLETKLAMAPEFNYQSAQLLLYATDGDWVGIGLGYSAGRRVSSQAWASGNMIANSGLPYPDTLVFLRLDAVDSLVTVSWSADSTNWDILRQSVVPWVASSDVYIGVEAENGPYEGETAPEIPADFDYFRVDTLPPCAVSKVHVPQDYSTVQEAVDATCDGDTIVLTAGHYPPINLTDNPRTIIGAGLDSTFVAGSSIVVGGSTVAMLTATGGSYTYALIVPDGYENSIHFEWVRATGAHVGLLIGGGGDPNPVVSSDSVFLDHCVFEFLDAYGVQQEDGSLVVDHCIFRNIGQPWWGEQNGGIVNCCRPPAGAGLDNLIVTNSVFINHRRWAINGNDTTASLPTSLRHNCYYNNGINFRPEWSDVGAVYADPLFVGGTPFDYHTQSGSPLIGAGDPTTPPDPDGTITDIGLYWNPTDDSNLCPPTELPFIDNFDNPDLDSCWFWIREDTSHWSLTERPGWMRITGDGNISYGQDDARNLMLRSLDMPSFRIETKVTHVRRPGAAAGLLVYLDDANFIAFNSDYYGGVRVWSETNGEHAIYDLNQYYDPVYLCISKIGSRWLAEASADSMNWSLVATWERDLFGSGIAHASIMTVDDFHSSSAIGDFDYFRADPLPGTTVCGDVTGVWDSTGSPYYVNCDVTVPAGQTLEIRPGVQVLFTGNYRIDVHGTIQAIGTEQDSIVFTRAFPTEESRGRNVRLISSPDTCRFSFCVLEYGNVTGPNTWENSFGGAIFSWSANALEVSHCTFRNNYADFDGGALHVFATPYSRIAESEFRDNFAANSPPGGLGAGALHYWGCLSGSVDHCAFDRNISNGGGGAIVNASSTLNVSRSTFARNDGHGSGSAIVSDEWGTTTAKSLVVWDNSGTSFGSLGGPIAVVYSDIQGGYPGIGNIDADPMFVDADNGDFHLQASSPCIDTGDPASPLDPDSTRADMGAFPFMHQNLIVTPDELAFGLLDLGADSTMSVGLFNPTAEPIAISSVSHAEPAFVVDTTGLNGSVPPYTGYDLNVTFSPAAAGSYEDTLLIIAQQAGDSMILIPMSGAANVILPPVDSLVIQKGPLNGIRLDWDAVTHSTSGQPVENVAYIVYGATSSEGPFVPFGYATTNSYVHPYIFNSQDIYFYQVTANVGARSPLLKGLHTSGEDIKWSRDQ